MEHVPPVVERWPQQLQLHYDREFLARTDALHSQNQLADNETHAILVVSKKRRSLWWLHSVPAHTRWSSCRMSESAFDDPAAVLKKLIGLVGDT